MPIPQPAQAWDWNSLWFTPNQQASQAFEKGEMEKSAELFENSEWKGAAQYKAGKYEEALKSLEGLDNPESWYNKANALAQLSRYPEAIEAYKKALKLNPKHQDAKYNKELVEKQLQKQQNQQQNQQNQQQNQQQNSEQNKQNKQNQQQNSEQNKQNQQDSKSADNHQQQNSEQQDKQNQQDSKSAEKSEEKQQSDEKEDKTTISTPDEIEQAKQQLLRQIPDDPGGLLRRKFKYQYQQQGQQSQGEQTW